MILDIELCGGQIINMGKPEFTMSHNYYSLIYLWDYYIAKRNFHRFDRIMKCDMFDTIFQGYPFNDAIKPDKFYMIEEGKPVSYTFYNNIINDLGITPKNEAVIACAGISFGYAEPFTRALDLFFSYFLWDKDWHDQHLFNVIFTYDLYKYNNVNFVSIRPNETVRHLYTVREDNEIGYITDIYNNNTFAQIIHHTHVARKLLDSMNKYCPSYNPELQNYVTKYRGT